MKSSFRSAMWLPLAAPVLLAPQPGAALSLEQCIALAQQNAPALQAADGGGVKIEIRMMFLRPDDEPRPILAQNLVRLSRGKMLGVDFNKEFTWVGSSIALS